MVAPTQDTTSPNFDIFQFLTPDGDDEEIQNVVPMTSNLVEDDSDDDDDDDRFDCYYCGERFEEVDIDGLCQECARQHLPPTDESVDESDDEEENN